MLNLLIKVVFFIVSRIASLIIAPIMLLVNAIIPNASTFYNYVISYLSAGISYMKFVFKVLLIPSSCIKLVYLIFTSFLAFIVGVRAYSLIVKLYDKFKP